MNLFSLVKAGTTLLGTAPCRFYEFGHAPELDTLPYATWQELSFSPFYTYDRDINPTDMIKVQIDVWATTTAEVRTITRQIRLALNHHVDVTFCQYTWDEKSNLYRSTTFITFAKEL